MSTRILIVDDSPVVRGCVNRLLRGHAGWEICGEAANGEDAVSQARRLAPDLIVLDFVMPGINGIETARQIKQIVPRTRILLCTVHLSSQLGELAREAGIMGTLSKGELNRLVPSIEAMLGGRAVFSPFSQAA